VTSSSQTDSWLTEARQGNAAALSKLLATYHARMRARVQAGLDDQGLQAKVGPDDIMQEVYIYVFRNLDQFEDRGPGSFGAWLNTVLDHKLIDAQRAARRRVRDIAREVPLEEGKAADSYWNLLDEVYADSRTPSRVVRRQEAIGALLMCISDLTDEQRQCVSLRFLEGLPVAQVARRGK